jgi:hypothetical protein
VSNILTCKCSKRELYGQAKKYLSSPVSLVGYIHKKELTEKMVLAGNSALAEKSMISTDILSDYSVYQRDIDKKLLSDELVDPSEQVRIEVWKYDPDLFSKEGIADPVSVALSLANEMDERIEIGIDEMLGNLWEDIDDKGI